MTQTADHPNSPLRALGLDIGTKTIGIALSDALGWTARPLMTIKRASWAADLATLRTLVETHEVGLLVVGLPLGGDGQMTEQARYSQRGAEKIQQELGLPVAFVDESMSSAEAEATLLEMGISRKKRKGISIDQQAAALILQDYLNQQQSRQRQSGMLTREPS